MTGVWRPPPGRPCPFWRLQAAALGRAMLAFPAPWEHFDPCDEYGE